MEQGDERQAGEEPEPARVLHFVCVCFFIFFFKGNWLKVNKNSPNVLYLFGDFLLLILLLENLIWMIKKE